MRMATRTAATVGIAVTGPRIVDDAVDVAAF
jgi:hypothetical protein